MVTCIFCGHYKLASIEDVISKWVRYALDPTSAVTIRAEPSGATAQARHLVVTLRDMVCEECNTGWMHDLGGEGQAVRQAHAHEQAWRHP
jgi:hypothetical protein